MDEKYIESIERLKTIYTDLDDSQLYEIALGEEAGIDFSSYAKAEFAPEYMEKIRLEKIDKKKKSITAFECRYFYGTVKYLDLFYNIKELLFESLINEEYGVSYKNIERWASSNGQLQGYLNKIYENMTKDLEIINIFDDKDARLPDKYSKIAENIKFDKTDFDYEITFPIEGTFDIYKAFGKGDFDVTKHVDVNSFTVFSVRNKLSSYSEKLFSIALKNDDFKFALAATPNRSAIKTDADMTIAFIEDGKMYIDTLAKYTDVSVIVAGLRS